MHTAQNMKFSIMDFFIRCDQTHRKLQIWSHLLRKSFTENFIFCTVAFETSPKYGHTDLEKCEFNLSKNFFKTIS